MAIFSSSFLFLHPVKTGGTWVEDRLGSLLPGQVRSATVTSPQGATTISQHLTLHEAKNLLPGRQLVISIRQPLSWYGSLYLHALRGVNGRKRLALYGGGKNDFRSVLYGMTHPQPERVPDYPIMLTTSGCAHRLAYASGSEGLYAHHFNHYYCPQALLLRQESLSRDFDQWQGADTSDAPHRNVGKRESGPPGSYSEWYDGEMLSWVEEADGETANFLGYDLLAL